MAQHYDCIIVGSGHAGSSAAFSAAQSGCKKVLVIDKCPPEWAGGNGYFTAGAHRIVHGGLQDILSLVSNVTSSEASKIDLEPYTIDAFTSDLQRLSGGQSNPQLVDALVRESRQIAQWLKDDIGVDFVMSFNRQAYVVGGRQVFWGGMALGVRDGGKGLIRTHSDALSRVGVEKMFNTKAVRLLMKDGQVDGLVAEKVGSDGQPQEVIFTTPCVILAAGGFEANHGMREKYLGKGWAIAKVRGTPYNTGDGFEIAQSVGANVVGDWGTCHSTCWDANASAEAGQRDLTNQFTKSGYPLGVMLNSQGERFVDEGEDFRNYTYAKFGRAILLQPQGIAFQVWDSKVIDKLRQEEYGDGVVEKIFASSVAELAEKLTGKGLESAAKGRFVKTMLDYNSAVGAHREQNADVHWDPAIKDGSGTLGLPLPKSNWALTIDKAPFMAVKVTCGITFTFGGLAIDPVGAGVVNEKGEAIEGLYCAGEMVGGLFYGNYPGGSGLTAGAVFGRKAGQSAAQRVKGTKVL